MKSRTAFRIGSSVGHFLLPVFTLVLVTYFLGVGQPGRAMMTGLAADEVHGTTVVGRVQVDPLSASAALLDVEFRTPDGEPAVTVSAVEVAATSLLGNEYSKLSFRNLKLMVALDEDGKFNLEGLLVEKPPRAHKEPSGLRIDALAVEESSAFLVTPDLTLELGPVTAVGAIEELAGELPGGRMEGRIGTFKLSPRSPAMEDLLAGLTGAVRAATIGPLDAQVHWAAGNVDVRSVQLTWESVQLYLQGRFDYLRLAGTVSLMATRDGKQVGSLLVRREGEDWAFSMLVSEANLPGRQGNTLTIPEVELSGLSISALPGQVSFRLNRLGIPRLDLDGPTLTGVSLSGSVQFESAQPLLVLAEGLAAEELTISDVAASWQQGAAVLSLLIESVGNGERELVAPLRLRVEAKRTSDHRVRFAADLSLHPHGTIHAELTADLRHREGVVPYVAQLHIKGLETEALLDLLAVPGMLRGMLSGRLEGSLEVAAHDLASTTVKVPYCRFDLTRTDGTAMVFRTPDDQQTWDFGVSPSFSFFSKEVKFGDGKLVMQVQPQG